jgi:putative aldouronate transport system substrate-binding protein
MKRLLVTIMVLSICGGAFAAGEAEGGTEATVYDITWTHGGWGAEIDPEGYFAEAVSEAVGVNLDMTLMAQGQLNQRYEVIFSSGDLPDMITLNVPKESFIRYARQGLIISLDEYWDEFPNIAENIPQEKLSYSTMVDGKIYAIPTNTGPISRFIGVRGDWLDHFGLDMPETLADMKEFARLVTFEDPDGNGEDDTYGFALHSGFFGPQNFFFPAFHAGFGSGGGSDPLVFRNGDVEFWFMQPGMKDAIAEMRAWWEDGLLDPRALTEKGYEKDLGWEAGLHAFGMTLSGQFPRLEGMLLQVDPNARFETLPSLENGEYGTWAPLKSSGYFRSQAITGLVEDEGKIRKILSIYEWLLDYESGLGEGGWWLAKFGIEGVHWNETNDDGIPIVNQTWGFNDGHSWPNFGLIVQPIDPKYQLAGDTFGTPAGERVSQAFEWYLDDAEPQVILGEAPQGFFDVMDSANNARNGAILEIIIGNRPVDDFEEIQATWFDAAEPYLEAVREQARVEGLID